jgi:hypothetical protein
VHCHDGALHVDQIVLAQIASNPFLCQRVCHTSWTQRQSMHTIMPRSDDLVNTDRSHLATTYGWRPLERWLDRFKDCVDDGALL